MADWTEQDGPDAPVQDADTPQAAESPAADVAMAGDSPQAAADTEGAAAMVDAEPDLAAEGADAAAQPDPAPEAEVAAGGPESGEAEGETSEPVAADAPAEAGDDAIPTDSEADAPVADEAEPADVEPISEEDLRRPVAELKAIVEALIFASPEPLTPKALLKLLDNEPKEDVLQALEEVKVDYQRVSGLQLVEVAGGFQIVTRADLHEWVRRLFHERSTQKLSVQALETLAVIAYRQPITALEITEIRGVSASGVLNTLLERHLVKIVGRKQVVGRPFMYATTREFLIRFGLKDIGDLPKVEDMAESLGIESTLLVEQTPPEEQLPLSEPDYSGADTSDQEADQTPDDGFADDEDEPSVH